MAQKIPCTTKENKEFRALKEQGKPLPEGVREYMQTWNDKTWTPTGEFYHYYECDLTDAERNEYLTYQKLHLLTTIKNCEVFFVVLTIIGLIITAIMVLNGGLLLR